ncbi:magnesium chelatase subunit D [Blastochloris viridis]|uniref:Magnesium-chelatase 60 kDa subunit n=1 Tax=Blastochloris viridis TaxID=1079 RepID=A0A0H5BB59_BLAVI|nr:magnesium chelatase subunit D [Blastochloris viridis]ALK08388.1 Magnesium-chelatase 60 kDa subunit [Blastochloris viridis]BAR98339.1 protoporphyrin IX Mg-chelatase subunit D [Blastochloris viridis]CUU41050.1 Magnesium-chelatase 60 kDa subunit [Blastochloris viridis]
MTEPAASIPPWVDAVRAAALFAVDPAGLVGIVLRAHAGPVRDRWLEHVRELLPDTVPVRRLPLHITDSRLLGGLDLAATLSAGRPVAEQGLLVDVDGGVLIAAMAERMAGGTAARLAAALDTGEVVLERDGLALRFDTRFGVIALDEGLTPDERPPGALLDRLGVRLDLSAVGTRDAIEQIYEPEDIAEARARLSSVAVGEDVIEALVGVAVQLGIDSIRAPLLALAAARASAALDERDAIGPEDAALAARLVFGARATRLPQIEEPPPPDQPDDDEPEPPDQGEEEEADVQPLEDLILEAAKAAIPDGLLLQLKMFGGRQRQRSSGKAGELHQSKLRGRPIGSRRGDPRAGVRINVVETLRSAAPWQKLRREEPGRVPPQPGKGKRVQPRVEVRRDDFRVTRYKHRSETTTIFVVDASGSTALNRLAEAKGAVELLLADCYVRRDQVAMLAFRGKDAELLLPPTRSLFRAKRCLAALPGGGGTPLAAGIISAALLAEDIRRRGQTPTIVFLTDGRGNIARDGTPGRAKADEDALAAAKMVRAANFTALLVDNSPHAEPRARKLASEMGAMYVALPYADAGAISAAVRATVLPAQRNGAPPR